MLGYIDLKILNHPYIPEVNPICCDISLFMYCQIWFAKVLFLLWEPYEQYEKAKRYDTERWTPHVGRCPICCWRNAEITSENEEMEPKRKQRPVVDVTGDGSKVRCCKEQYCIETWNVRSMNRGKLLSGQTGDGKSEHWHLGINLLKWTGMGEFNSDDHYIYYWARIP